MGEIMKLPYLENAMIPPSKITEYLLNLEHEDGKSKAVFFLMMGFSLGEWQLLRDVLLKHAQYDVVNTLQTTRGVHYVIEGIIETPSKSIQISELCGCWSMKALYRA